MVPGRYFSKAAFLLLAVILILLLLTTLRLQDGTPPSPAMLQALAGEWLSHYNNQEYGHSQPPVLQTEDTPGTDTAKEETTLPSALVEEKPTGCEEKGLQFLRLPHLGLTDKIAYSRSCIKPMHNDVNRNIVTNIIQPLFTSRTPVNLRDNCLSAKLPPCEPITLQVPPTYPKRPYRHLLFAVASTYDRINSSVPAFAHWLAGTGARLLIVISDIDSLPTRYSLPVLEEAYRSYGILATVTFPKSKESLPRKNQDSSGYSTISPGPAPVEQLHFMLIRDLLDASSSETRWLGILDDDTFFPALYPLDQALGQYDSSLPTYLGALSDNWESVKQWGYMAYGGAGVFLSVPLARSLNPLLETCIQESTIISGDGMLRDCIYTYTSTKLTVLPGLYQHDLRGDPSGFYESGVLPLSVHHWKSWYHAPVDKMAAITSVCGDCFLQRFRFDQNMLLANGYSITQYPSLDGIDLERVEGTWLHPDDGYEFTYGPMRPKLDEKTQKKSWRLVDVVLPPENTNEQSDGKKTFRQVYVHYDASTEQGNKGAMDEVVELVWEM